MISGVDPNPKLADVMILDEAFYHFRQRLVESGVGEPKEELYPELSGRRCSEIEVDHAVLRLVFDGRDESLILEISQGPDASEAEGWLDLYRASFGEGRLVIDRFEGPDLADCIDYGIELLSPKS